MIYTINSLDTTECGPESEFEGFMQKVFLQQGSIDGACGPYSIFMGLLSLGLISYDKITSRTVKGNERLGKLLNKLNNEYYSLFKNGTYLKDLEEIITETFGKVINVKTLDEKNNDVLNFTIEHLKENHPTIIGVNFDEGGHWMLAVGYETNENDEVVRILALDSSGENPIVSTWNSIIDAKTTKRGKYKYKWWTKSTNVEYEQAIAMWKK